MSEAHRPWSSSATTTQHLLIEYNKWEMMAPGGSSRFLCSCQPFVREDSLPEEARLRSDVTNAPLVPSIRPPSPPSPLSLITQNLSEGENRPRKRRLCSAQKLLPDVVAHPPLPSLVAPQPNRVSIYPSPPLSTKQTTISLPLVDDETSPCGPITRCYSSPACLCIDQSMPPRHDPSYLPPSPPATLPTPTHDLPVHPHDQPTCAQDSHPDHPNACSCSGETSFDRAQSSSPLTPVSPTRIDYPKHASNPSSTAPALPQISEDFSGEEFLPQPHFIIDEPPVSETWTTSPAHEVDELPLLNNDSFDQRRPPPFNNSMSVLSEGLLNCGPRQHIYPRDSVELRQDDDELYSPLTPMSSIRLHDRLPLHPLEPPGEEASGLDCTFDCGDNSGADGDASRASMGAFDLHGVPQPLDDVFEGRLWDSPVSMHPPLLDFRDPFPFQEDARQLSPKSTLSSLDEVELGFGDAFGSGSVVHHTLGSLSLSSDSRFQHDDDDDMDDRPLPSPRQRLSSLPELDPLDDLGADTHALPSPSPSRRSFSDLPEVGSEHEDMVPEIDVDTSSRSPSIQLLSFPGSDVDQKLIMHDEDESMDVMTPSPNRVSSLGIYIPATEAPREVEPDLTFPSEACEKVDADELAKLTALRRKIWFHERNAKRVELDLADQVRECTLGQSLSPPVPSALAECDRDVGVLRPLSMAGTTTSELRRKVQILEARRADSRRDRKLFKDRGKEVQCLLRFKLGETIAERERSAEAAAKSVAVNAEGVTAEMKRDGRAKAVIKSMPHLVARMVLKRREVSRPLSGRQLVYESMPSSLASSEFSNFDGNEEHVLESLPGAHSERDIEMADGD